MLVLLVFVAVVSANQDDSVQDEKTEKLVKNLRKRLMSNNYDYYLSNESNDVVNLRARSDENKDPVGMRKSTVKYNTSRDINRDLRERDNNLEQLRQATTNEVDVTVKARSSIEVAKTDLLYYIDDKHLVSKPGAMTKKYKVLKLKHNSRRSGAVQIIQEEGKDGITLLNLGGGPFPEFRLPKSRRQYMHDHGELISDEEVLTPPSNDTVVNNPYVEKVIK